MSEHIVPKRVYILVFAVLIAFTVLTTAVAYVDLGPFNTVVALAIAVCKASLVVLFFMHMKYELSLMKWLTMTAGVICLALMMSFFPDAFRILLLGAK